MDSSKGSKTNPTAPSRKGNTDTNLRPCTDRKAQAAKVKRQRAKLARRQPDKVPQQCTRVFSAAPGPASFCGQFFMRGRADAVDFAKSIYTAPDRATRVFWADGAYVNLGDKGAGAAVVYRADPWVSDWTQRGYAVSGLHGSRELELFAIGAALRVAVLEAETDADTDMASQGSSQLSPSPSPTPSSASSTSLSLTESPTRVVIVFTDSKSCMELLGSWPSPTDAYSDLSKTTVPLVQQVVRLSQQLRDVGVQVEVHWAPAHMSPPIPGHKEADLLARAATRLQAPLAAKCMNQSADGAVLMVSASYLG